MPEAVRAPISVCIVCHNERDRLGPCLESVVGWAAEVIMMDLESTDGSPELARSNGVRVISRERVPIVETVRNEIAAEAVNDWILVLDPDERVTPGLAEEIRSRVSDDGIDAMVIPRMNYDFGYPPSSPWHRYEPQLRVYRRSRVSWPTTPNALPQVPEDRVFRVAARDELVLIHDRSRNIPEVLERSIRYAPAQAQSMIDRGEEFSVRAMAQALSRQVVRHFFKARALRDGMPGLLRASVLVLFHFYVWAAFWQLSGARRTRADDRYLLRVARLMDTMRWTGRTLTLPTRWVRRLATGFKAMSRALPGGESGRNGIPREPTGPHPPGSP